MRRLAGWLLAAMMVFSLSAALAQRVSCPDGGFSLRLPDHFVEESTDLGDPDLCFYWRGSKLTVQAYAAYQGEVAGSDLFQVLTGYETEYGKKNINGMNMLYARTEEYGEVRISYTWMDRGNCVTLEFCYSAADSSVLDTVKSIMSSISFDAGH